MRNKTFFILFAICYLLLTNSASAATLYYQAANQNIFEGQTFVVDWYINTEGINVNSLDLVLSYSPETLEVLESTVGNSVVSLWIKMPTANNGKISLTGGVPNGFNGNTAPVFRTTFKAIKPGVATISLDPSSMVLRNDGSGQAEALRFQNLSFTVQPKDFQTYEVSSSTHPDQSIWYKNRDVIINFIPKQNEEYSFSFSANPDIIPEDNVAPTQTQFVYNDRPDGVYYFKALARISTGSWKEAAIYRVQIDSTLPENFTPQISSDPSIFDGKRFVSFSTLDKVSGISHYMVKTGLFRDFEVASSPHKLTRPIVGDNVEIKAIDNAGNERIVNVRYQGYIPVIWYKVLLILIGLGSLVYIFKIKYKKDK